MGEQSIIESTRKPNTIESISHELVRLGIEEGEVLLVHSSLSRIGWVCGEAQAIIMALQKVVGSSGTLVMPSHSGQISDPAEWENPPVPKEWLEDIYIHMPEFDPDCTPTRGMGRIAEEFRSVPGTIRSNHPQVSFTAKGPKAGEITSDHPLTPQFGMNSPLGALYRQDAKVLLLGAGYDTCTSFHLAETLISTMPQKKMGAAIMENGLRTWKWFQDYAYDSDDFGRLGEDYEKQCSVISGQVGLADCKLLSVRTAVDFAVEWLTKHRFSL